MLQPTHFGAIAFPLQSGDAGIAQTLGHIRRYVHDGKKTPEVREATIHALCEGGADQYDLESEARAVYEWVRRNIRYVQDPINAEAVSPPDVILWVGAGDCDDINGVLIPSMLGSIGIETRLVTVATDPNMPEQFTHIYAEALLSGRWVALDAARPGAMYGLEPARVFRRKEWALEGSTPSVGRLGSMSGAGMGFDWGALVSALPQIGQTTTQIIQSAKNPWGIPYPTGTIYAGGGQTYSPGQLVTPQSGAVATVQGNTLLLLGVLGLGIMMLVKK